MTSADLDAIRRRDSRSTNPPTTKTVADRRALLREVDRLQILLDSITGWSRQQAVTVDTPPPEDLLDRITPGASRESADEARLEEQRIRVEHLAMLQTILAAREMVGAPDHLNYAEKDEALLCALADRLQLNCRVIRFSPVLAAHHARRPHDRLTETGEWHTPGCCCGQCEPVHGALPKPTTCPCADCTAPDRHIVGAGSAGVNGGYHGPEFMTFDLDAMTLVETCSHGQPLNRPCLRCQQHPFNKGD